MMALNFREDKHKKMLIARTKRCTVRLGDISAQFPESSIVWITTGKPGEQKQKLYTAFLDKQQKELGYALRELAERQRAVSDLETTIANHQTKLQTYNQEVAQKAAALANIEAELKARVASVKAEQKAAKSMQ